MGFLWLLSVTAFHSSGFAVRRTSIREIIPILRPTTSRPTAWPHESKRRNQATPMNSSSAQTPDFNEEAGDGSQTETTSLAKVPVDGPRGIKRVLRRVARFFGAGKEVPDIKQLGLYAVLSYGFLSNMSYVISTSIAWYISSRNSGLSPLAPGQWQLFLVCWTGLWAVNNVLRVPRLALAVAISPTFDRLIGFLMKKTGRGKVASTALLVFLVNVVGTLTAMSSGIYLASLLSGVPIWSVS